MAIAGFAIAGVVASVLTLFDLDLTFYVPSSGGQRFWLWVWWWGFVIANGVLAGLLELALVGVSPFSSMPWPVAPLAIGLAYLALLRLKLSTFTYNNRQVPFGIDAVYEQAKQFVYKRINRIARDARRLETLAYARSNSLADLATEVRLTIDQDALITAEEKRAAKKWLLDVLNDASPELDRKAALSNFIKSGDRPPLS